MRHRISTSSNIDHVLTISFSSLLNGWCRKACNEEIVIVIVSYGSKILIIVQYHCYIFFGHYKLSMVESLNF